ncbi:MAG: hypothetical protein LBT22_02770 [Peptococcaceae bacterium]|nr:hypothetical protein [Peptococcaceae bacterium]
MSKNKNIIIALLAAVVLLLSGGSVYLDALHNQSALSTPTAPVESVLGYRFFDHGSYEDYAAAFKREEWVTSKDDLKELKQRTAVEQYFPGDNSLEEVMSHMTVENQTEDQASVVWQGEGDASPIQRWPVVKIGQRWVIDN